MEIAFVIYDGFTALDLVGAYEVIASWPDARSHFLATERRPHVADNGLIVSPTDTPESLPRADMIVIPGSSRPFGPLENQALLAWIRGAAPQRQWLRLGVHRLEPLRRRRRARPASGDHPLGVPRRPRRHGRDGLHRAGGHRPALHQRRRRLGGHRHGAHPTARIHGEETARLIQLAIEYDPQPPFDAGSPEKAGPQLVGEVLNLFAAGLQQVNHRGAQRPLCPLWLILLLRRRQQVGERPQAALLVHLAERGLGLAPRRATPACRARAAPPRPSTG